VRDRRNHRCRPERPANNHDARPRAAEDRQHHYALADSPSPAPAPAPAPQSPPSAPPPSPPRS